MDNNFDFNSKKYMILLILICLVFTIFIIKAFDYLPAEDVEITNNNTENINTPATVNEQDEQKFIDNADDNIYKPQKRSGVIYKSKYSLTDEQNFDEIDAPGDIINESSASLVKNDNNLSATGEVLALKYIIDARRYTADGDLSAALNEYKKAMELTNDNELKSEIYQGVATLYAKNEKYDTALTFANKANELSSTTERQFLIAKIYYLNGQSDLAIKKMNNILRQGFKN